MPCFWASSWFQLTAPIPSRYMANWLLMIAFVSAVNIVFLPSSAFTEVVAVLQPARVVSSIEGCDGCFRIDHRGCLLIDIVDIPRSVIVCLVFEDLFIGGIRLASGSTGSI